MDITIKQNHLYDALDRLDGVAGCKVRKPELKGENTITIATSDKDPSTILFYTTNGYTFATWKVNNTDDPDLAIVKAGKATVDLAILKKIVSTLGNEDHHLNITSDGTTLILKDVDSGSDNTVTLQCMENTLVNDHSDKEGGYKIPAEIFSDVIGRLPQYAAAVTTFRIAIQMVCLHVFKDKIRAICGEGQRFAVLEYKTDVELIGKTKIDEANGVKHLLPAEQTKILSKLIRGSKFVTLDFKDGKSCRITADNGADIIISGLPDVDYIRYERYAYPTDHTAIVDIANSDFVHAIKVTGAVIDKAYLEKAERNHEVHCEFKNGSKDQARFMVKEGRFRCSWPCSASFYSFNGTKEFKDHYAWTFLNDLSGADDRDHLRLYCADTGKILVVDYLNLSDQKDSSGIPLPVEDSNNPKLRFFLSASLQEASDAETE